MTKAGTKQTDKINIGMGHMVRTMQVTGWGHDQIMTMREAMITGNFSGIKFCGDCYTDDWDDKDRIAE